MSVSDRGAIQLVYSFLKHKKYSKSLWALIDESEVPFNLVRCAESQLKEWVLAGSWVEVLGALGDVSLPAPTAAQLYEQVIYELVESDNLEGAKLLSESASFRLALKHDSALCQKLLSMSHSSVKIDMRVIYDQEERGTKTDRRNLLWLSLRPELHFEHESAVHDALTALIIAQRQR